MNFLWCYIISNNIVMYSWYTRKAAFISKHLFDTLQNKNTSICSYLWWHY